MDKQTAKDILTRYCAGDCTEDERQLVENWILHGAAEPLDLSDAQLLDDLLEIRRRLEREVRLNPPVRKLGHPRWLPYAAALLVIAFGIGWYYSGQNQQRSVVVSRTVSDIEPGGNKATLTLADGRTIGLNAEQSGIVVGDDGITYSDGKAILDRELYSKMNELTTDDLQLTTPKGGTYQITLPDGTSVWLNAGSTLRYPSRFEGNERVVELQGEAYFEVRSKPSATGGTLQAKMPFLVKTRDQVVKVLGTQFNISAYTDEDKTFTTLVEGSVQVVPTDRSSSLIKQQDPQPATLTPGTQSIVQNGHTTINAVDVSTFIGWRSGYFVFDGVDLRDAMRQLSRWYDVEVHYDGIIPPTPLYGKISRSDTLAEVLAIFKESKINFRIEEYNGMNRVVVMP